MTYKTYKTKMKLHTIWQRDSKYAKTWQRRYGFSQVRETLDASAQDRDSIRDKDLRTFKSLTRIILDRVRKK